MRQDIQLPDSISLEDFAAIEESIPGGWDALRDSFIAPDAGSVISLTVFLAVGGVLGMYLRFLYRRTGRPTSTDSIAKVFPMLTLVTIAVITVVKSSLALSLGLVGALSIVRFRAAIKDPEELVYLFLCIGVGLSLGAEQLWPALVLVAMASLFTLVFDRVGPAARTDDGYLTIVGTASRYFSGSDPNALETTRNLWPNLTVQRCDIDGDEGQLRVQVHRLPAEGGPKLVADLMERLPECQISYVRADSIS